MCKLRDKIDTCDSFDGLVAVAALATARRDGIFLVLTIILKEWRGEQ